MKNIPILALKTYAPKAFFILAILLLAIIQLPTHPLVTPLSNIKPQEAEAADKNAAVTKDAGHLALGFFGEETPANVINSIVQKKEDFISTHPVYPAALKVIAKHETTIRQKAQKYGVPADVAIGVGLLENGGSETAKSRSGAMGIFQLMPGTARNLGLKVTKKVDQRKDPVKNIDAGMRYLSANYGRFGDWGLATWAYHAGEGNVAKAVKLYVKERYNVNLEGLKNIPQMRAHIVSEGITIHDILSSPAVKQFTKKLHDDSTGYPYKVLATAKLFKKFTAAKLPG